MPRTAEQEEADHALQEAIANSARAYGQTDEYVVAAWVVVAQYENLEDADDEEYMVFTPSASFPRFHTVGLLATGVQLMDGWARANQ